MKHSLLRLCGAGALVLPLSVWASAQGSFYNQATSGSSAGGTLEMFNRLQSQEQDINQLRGQIEELRHQLDQQRQLSQQRYLDLEEQLNQVRDSASSGGQSGAGSSGSSSASSDPINQAAASGSSGGAGSSASGGGSDAESAYRDAFTLVRNREFEQAIAAFQSFNENYPNSTLVGNSWYWLGELYSAQSELDQSAEAFRTVIDDYPQNSKVADAMYKLGLVYARQGNGSQSRQMLDRVISEHADSDAADRAREFRDQTSG